MEYTLKVENLCKKYKKSDFGLDNVTFAVPQGTIMGFVGKNGAGKTTTINAILNIIHKDSGTVKLFGNELTDANSAVRNDIAVVFDVINFSQQLTVKKLENVLADIYTNWDSKRFAALLERFALPTTKKIKTFSRGMSMKLAIAVALSHEAKFLILDEATAGLDPVVREEILDIFLEFMEDETHAILMSSHITSDLEKVADYITFIDGGRIVLTEKKDTLIYDYGIARCRTAEFERVDSADYLAYRKRGLQIEVLLADRKAFAKKHPDIIVDHVKIDEILALLIQEVE